MDAHAAFGFHPLEAEASTKDEAAESSEAQYAEYCQVALSEVKRSFRPEFLNRIQEQIVFRPLTPDVFRAILAKLVSRLNDRLRDKAIVVRLSPEAEAKLVDHGYDDEYGARALERVFERQISDRLAAELLDGRVRDGQQVFVTASEEGYCFRADSTA